MARYCAIRIHAVGSVLVKTEFEGPKLLNTSNYPVCKFEKKISCNQLIYATCKIYKDASCGHTAHL